MCRKPPCRAASLPPVARGGVGFVLIGVARSALDAHPLHSAPFGAARGRWTRPLALRPAWGRACALRSLDARSSCRRRRASAATRLGVCRRSLRSLRGPAYAAPRLHIADPGGRPCGRRRRPADRRSRWGAPVSRVAGATLAASRPRVSPLGRLHPLRALGRPSGLTPLDQLGAERALLAQLSASGSALNAPTGGLTGGGRYDLGSIHLASLRRIASQMLGGAGRRLCSANSPRSAATSSRNARNASSVSWCTSSPLTLRYCCVLGGVGGSPQ